MEEEGDKRSSTRSTARVAQSNDDIYDRQAVSYSVLRHWAGCARLWIRRASGAGGEMVRMYLPGERHMT
jgi:hypothetical protein